MCGYPCACGCNLFDIIFTDGGAAPDGVTDIGAGWYSIDKKLPGKNFVFQIGEIHDYGSHPAGLSPFLSLEYRIRSKTLGIIASGTIEKDVYGQQYSWDTEGAVDAFKLTTTLPDSFNAVFKVFSQPALIPVYYGLRMQFEDTATLIGGYGGQRIYTDYSINPRWPADVYAGFGSVGENGYYIVGKQESIIYASPSTADHPLALEVKPSWAVSLSGQVQIYAQRTEHRSTGHRAACPLFTSCTQNAPSYSTPRWVHDQVNLPDGNYDWSQSGADVSIGSDLVTDLNDRLESTALSPSPQYRRTNCRTESSAKYPSTAVNERKDADEASVAFIPDPGSTPGTYNWQGGGTFPVRPWLDPQLKIELIEDQSSPGKRKVRCTAEIDYFGESSASPSDTITDPVPSSFLGGAKQEVRETNRRKYFYSSTGAYTAAPSGLTTGNDYLVTNFGAVYTNRSLTLIYEKEVDDWTGTPPTILFTETDLVNYQVSGATYTPADLSGLAGQDYYLTSINTTVSGSIVSDGTSYTSTGELAVSKSATAIDFADFSFQFIPDPAAGFPHPA